MAQEEYVKSKETEGWGHVEIRKTYDTYTTWYTIYVNGDKREASPDYSYIEREYDRYH